MHLDDSTTPTPDPDRAGVGYFQGKWPVSLILGSFFLLTVPLWVLGAGDHEFMSRRWIGVAYVCVSEARPGFRSVGRYRKLPPVDVRPNRPQIEAL